MIEAFERYCAKCGYKVNLPEDKFCPSCGEAIPRPEEVVSLEEIAKSEPIIEKSPFDEYKEKNSQTDLWLSGSYSLVIIANLLTVILAVIGLINPFFLPLVLFITLFGIALFGAWKLQINQNNQEKSFAKLMLYSLRNFLLHNIEPQKPKKSG
ncbi:MAG: hypothetical protein ABIK93_02465 [candidate division WOR-3 bacterium]